MNVRKIICILLGAKALIGIGYSQAQNEVQTWNMTNTLPFTVNTFTSIAIDTFGTVWAGSSGGGLYTYKNNTWSKYDAIPYPDISYRDITVAPDGNVWAASIGKNGNLAETGGVFYINTSTNTTLRYGSVTEGGLSSRMANSLAISKGYIYAGLGQTQIGINTLEGGVYRMSISNPVPATPTSFTKVNFDIGGGILYPAVGNRNDTLWFAKGVFCSGTCVVPRIFRMKSDLTFTTPVSNTNSPIPFASSAGSPVPRAIFTDTITGNTFVGLSAGAGVGVLKADGTWKLLTTANSGFPLNGLVNYNAIARVNNEIWIGTHIGIFAYNGTGSLDDSSSFNLYTTCNGLPVNNITDIAFDADGSRVWLTSAAGVTSFLYNSLEGFESKLVWDNSYPNIGNPKPIGIAADGVSRLYIDFANKKDCSLLIKKVQVKIVTDNPPNLKGKIMKVNPANYFAYSEEANGATDTAADVFVENGFSHTRFWYVAPDDFSGSNDSVKAIQSERTEKLKIKVTYTNESIEHTELTLSIVRPPLLLVHGINSGPEAWDEIKYNNGNALIIESPLFKHRKALTMDARSNLKVNALTLLADHSNSNSFRNAVNVMRMQGYASTQVDYVCHSMGGLMARSAINDFPGIYFNSKSLGGANYGKGYIHKLIAINSPLNGSTLSDLLSDFSPLLPPITTQIFGHLFQHFPLEFLEPIPSNGLLPVMPSSFMPNDAVKNIATLEKNGGINFPQTDVKNHLLTGNVAWTSAEDAQAIFALEPILDYVDGLIGGARDMALASDEKVFLTGLLGLPKLTRVWSFIEWYNAKLGYHNFLDSSDLVVPLASQQAGQNPYSFHITNFLNKENFLDASHTEVLRRDDFGGKVIELLNETINSASFADAIPENIDPEIEFSFKPGNAQIPPNRTTNYNTSKIQINKHLDASRTVKADSTFQVQILVHDTVGLAYIKVFFQDSDTTTLSRDAIQHFNFTVNPSFADSQLVIAIGIYDNSTQIEYHVDTLYKMVEMNELPSQFRFTSAEAEVFLSENYVATMEAMYNGKWIPFSVANKQLHLSLSNQMTGSINEFNAFVPSKADTVRMYAVFYGLKDTLNITMLAGPLANAYNYTVASGNVSDPTIWSRGIVPDILDSIVIKNGHLIIVDTMLRVRFLFVEPGGGIRVSEGDTLTIEPINIFGYLPFKEEKIATASFYKMIALKIIMHQQKKLYDLIETNTSFYTFRNHTLSKCCIAFHKKIPGGIVGDS